MNEEQLAVFRKVWMECRLREKASIPPEVMDDGVIYLQLRLTPPRGPVQMQTWKQELERAARTLHQNFEEPDVRACSLGIAVLLEPFEPTGETFPLHDPPL